MSGKIIIISAPSGTGKSTIINRIIKDEDLKLGFSISATCRKPRENEKHGKDYYFMTEAEFDSNVESGKFVEWEEVYDGIKYGTLESEVSRVVENGNNLIMDVDVKGAINIKKRFGDKALMLFIMPPSLEKLKQRLENRGTDSKEMIGKRLEKARYEIGFAEEFDAIVMNDILEDAVNETRKLIENFVQS